MTHSKASDVELKTAHTPGPWRAHKSPTINGNPDLWEIHWSDDGECVAEIVHGEANARVIAEAADLLKALKALIDGDAEGTLWSRRMRFALDTIARAESRLIPAIAKAEARHD